MGDYTNAWTELHNWRARFGGSLDKLYEGLTLAKDVETFIETAAPQAEQLRLEVERLQADVAGAQKARRAAQEAHAKEAEEHAARIGAADKAHQQTCVDRAYAVDTEIQRRQAEAGATLAATQEEITTARAESADLQKEIAAARDRIEKVRRGAKLDAGKLEEVAAGTGG